MIRTYTPNKGAVRLSKHHIVADYWKCKCATLRLSDDLVRVISLLEETLGAPVQFRFVYDTNLMCKRLGKDLSHSRGTAIDIAPPKGVSFITVLHVLEHLLGEQACVGWNRRSVNYIHIDVASRHKRWVLTRQRKVRIPINSFLELDE